MLKKDEEKPPTNFREIFIYGAIFCFHFENKMNDLFESPAFHVLKICAADRYSMRELLNKLRQNYDKSYYIIKELKKYGLIRFSNQKNSRGRPSKIIIPTSLGKEFLDSYLKDQLKRIQLTDENVRKAIYLAGFADYLEESGVNLYDRLSEMNELAFSIRGSA